MSGITRTLFGGSTSSSNQQSTQQSQQSSVSGSRSSSRTALDPRAFSMFNQNLSSARNTAANLRAREIADFGQDFDDGRGLARDTVLNGPGMQTTGRAVGFAGDAAGFSPDQLGIRSLLDVDMNQYMNPFTDNVINQTISDMDRARQMTQMQNADAAARSGAFGGSRQGVLEAETNRNFFDRLGATTSALRSDAFNNATGLALSDVDRAAQTDAINQAAGLDANQQRISAAALMGDLGAQQQQMGLQGAEALVQLDAMQRERQQMVLDAIRNLPLEQQAILNEALGINPMGGSGMVTTSDSSSFSRSEGTSSAQSTGTSSGTTRPNIMGTLIGSGGIPFPER